MDKQKWYYEITDNKTKESVYVAINLPITAEKVIELLGLDDVFKLGATIREISKEEYEEKAD